MARIRRDLGGEMRNVGELRRRLGGEKSRGFAGEKWSSIVVVRFVLIECGFKLSPRFWSSKTLRMEEEEEKLEEEGDAKPPNKR